MTMLEFKPIILEEDCAPRRVLELFSVKWTTMVLHSLHFNGGTCRTGTLARSLPGCSKKMLTQTLREMERDGLIDRKVYPVVPPMVEYSRVFLAWSLEAVRFFRLLLSFDNASSFLAAHAYSISIGSMKSRPMGVSNDPRSR
jgi:DNA-binding HxlR family transcriptional regulator